MPNAGILAASAANRWLVCFIVTTLVVLAASAYVRKESRARTSEQGNESRHRGFRRRAGAVVALGPLIGFVVTPTTNRLTLVIAFGVPALAIAGMFIERAPRPERLALALPAAGAVVAVFAGARLEPTGVGPFDVLGALLLIIAVTKSIDGFGNVDGLGPTSGVLAGAGLFAMAAFAHADSLASVLLGLASACFAFLAFNSRPASLFIGRGGRLAIGFGIAVGALAVPTTGAAWRGLVTPLIVLALYLLDATIVFFARLRRRRSLLTHRNDHLVHRLVALGWTPLEAVTFLAVAQLVLSVIAVFVARSVMSVWLALPLTILVVLVVGIEVGRAHLEREPADGLPVWMRIALSALGVFIALAIAPLALSAPDTVDLMQKGREAATRGLTAAREGDTPAAETAFAQASAAFGDASDKLGSPLLSGGLAVPFLAQNVDAARALAEIGTDLANAGVSLSAAVNPDSLEVVDGRLPVEEVVKVTPQLEEGATALSSARARLDDIRDRAYLAAPVHDAIDKMYEQLARADREAQHAVAAARLAPAIFGADGDRTYLLVVQNNAESRATGGFIGSYALITAHDGDLDVGEMVRTNKWNEAIRENDQVSYTAPPDYRSRYQQYRPDTNLQNVNLTPDFPTVAGVLESLATQAGLPPIDGVISVDPVGLAALLELTGPVDVPGWPTRIDSGNVVNVTLRDAYTAFANTPERADFLGDVAKVAVDEATSGTLGKPAHISKVLGKAAHAGHITLAFTRPEEQRLTRQLDVAGDLKPVKSDAIAVTTSNAAANKIDYYLQRRVDYRATVTPSDGTANDDTSDAAVQSTFTVALENTAPDEGLPQIVIGPFVAERFVAGQNRTLLSLYSPLGFTSAAVDGEPNPLQPGRERGRNVYSLIQDIPSKSTKTTSTVLDGSVELHDGWYSLAVRAQPTLLPDRLNVSIDVPEGWKIDDAPGMERPFERRATVVSTMEQSVTYRVHIVRDTVGMNLWQRLQAGS